ncbi:MAG: SIR2 family protein [Bacteroidota bacterium]
MTPNVVYVLGAGFSAPLGLPVMSNFLLLSKDLYFSKPAEYRYFADVFHQIAEMSSLKNYYRADLYNIEEILSILEMQSFVGGDTLAEGFRRYISATIEAYTPPMQPYPGPLPSNWHRHLFGSLKWAPYGYFVADLCNLIVSKADHGSGKPLRHEVNLQPAASYSVVTLNYDRVLETVCEYLSEHSFGSTEVRFQRAGQSNAAGLARLVKLHGDLDPTTIVPPTWNKGTHAHVIPEWSTALRLLQEANYIRILGYSLPESDEYVRYLLKSAAIKAPHLKGIDVLCMDPTGQVRMRYDKFIEFNYYRFVNARIEAFFDQYMSLLPTGIQPTAKWYDRLEEAHEQFFAAANART